MSATSTNSNSIASPKKCHNTIDSNYIDASEEISFSGSAQEQDDASVDKKLNFTNYQLIKLAEKSRESG